LLQALREGRAIALLPDQSHKDVFIEFFGKPAGTALGPAVLAERTGAPMLPVFCYRIGPGRYRMDVLPPIEVDHDEEDRPLALTKAFTAELEGAIRAHPEQWLWFHDRWRSARQKGLL
jgi:KDO2-lipid IV(A) lauroyltransferase